MKRQSRDLLHLVRDAENPTRADEERVLSSLHAAVAAGMPSILDRSAAFEPGFRHAAKAKLGAFGSKLSVIAACTGAALGTADTAPASAPTLSTAPLERFELLAASSAEAVTSVEAVTRMDAVTSSAEAVTSAGAMTRMAEAVTRAEAAEKAVLAPQSKAPSVSNPRAGTLLGELELLQRVQAALQRRDGQAALGELDSYRAGGRELSAERQAARVLALCMLGRGAEARRVAVDFARRHPDSVQREAIANSCANRETDG